MRVCQFLLVAALALVASSNGVQASVTTQLVSPDAVPTVGEEQKVDTGKRFLRSYEDDDSEERIKLPVGVLKPENLKVDDLLNKNMLDRALNGNKLQRNKLFGLWAVAPKRARLAAIQHVLLRRGGSVKNKKFFHAWNKYLKRINGGVTRNTN